MAKGNFKIRSIIYSDSASTNNPTKKNFDYEKDFNLNSIGSFSEQKLSLAIGDNVINLPDTTVNLIYLETDQSLALKFNGSADEVVLVSPTVIGNIDSTDGVFFKKGSFTSLTIKNLGSAVANCLLFIGA